MVTAANGKTHVNGLTFHRIGGSGTTRRSTRSARRATRTTRPPRSAPAAGSRRPRRSRRRPTTPSRTRSTRLRPARLVVVYPNKPSANPRQNPRGAYYENLIIATPVKLQGVGPGGFQGGTYVPGSIIDGGAFGGDTPGRDRLVRHGRRAAPGTATRPSTTARSSTLCLAEQRRHRRSRRRSPPTTSAEHRRLRPPRRRPEGFPGNINEIGGVPTGLPPAI